MLCFCRRDLPSPHAVPRSIAGRRRGSRERRHDNRHCGFHESGGGRRPDLRGAFVSLSQCPFLPLVFFRGGHVPGVVDIELQGIVDIELQGGGVLLVFFILHRLVALRRRRREKHKVHSRADFFLPRPEARGLMDGCPSVPSLFLSLPSSPHPFSVWSDAAFPTFTKT